MEHPPATVTHAQEYVRLPGELNPGCTRKSRIVQAMSTHGTGSGPKVWPPQFSYSTHHCCVNKVVVVVVVCAVCMILLLLFIILK